MDRKEPTMATLNHIMPGDLGEVFCEREEKQHKNKHSWKPSGQTKASLDNQIALECYCKHCNLREWTPLALNLKCYKPPGRNYDETTKPQTTY